MRKGVLLAGGTGSRLYPASAVNKHLLPIYDKPMVHYPMTTLIGAGCQDVLLISTPEALPWFRQLYGDGSRLGLAVSYAEQDLPRGIADALMVGREHIGAGPVLLALGDNVFHGVREHVRETLEDSGWEAVVFAAHVADPERYGVLSFDERNRPVDIVEKPTRAPSNWAVTGLYAYDAETARLVDQLEPSARGELEISDLNKLALDAGELEVSYLPPGAAWLDTGTPDALAEASAFVRAVQNRQCLPVGCPEEAAVRAGLCTADHVLSHLPRSPYRHCLECWLRGLE